MKNNMKRLFVTVLLFALAVSLISCNNAPDVPGAYEFKYGQITITVGAEATPVLDAMGTPKIYDEEGNCGLGGMDRIYTYAGVELQTYEQGNKEIIRSVTVLDDSVSTPEGITIGSDGAAVDAAYGTSYTPYNLSRVYQKGNVSLEIYFVGNKVSGIVYREAESGN